AIISHLFRYLELLVPGFSIAQFRRDLHQIKRGMWLKWLEDNPDAEMPKAEFVERSTSIIDRCLPASRYDDGSKPPGPFPRDFAALVHARRSTDGGGLGKFEDSRAEPDDGDEPLPR